MGRGFEGRGRGHSKATISGAMCPFGGSREPSVPPVFNKLRVSTRLSRQRSRVRAPSSPPLNPEHLWANGKQVLRALKRHGSNHNVVCIPPQREKEKAPGFGSLFFWVGRLGGLTLGHDHHSAEAREGIPFCFLVGLHIGIERDASVRVAQKLLDNLHILVGLSK